jgi:hypothetical protein
VKQGDLVEYAGLSYEAEGRTRGIAIRFDIYESQVLGHMLKTPLVEVLWEQGPGWIDRQRVVVIDENT